MYTVKETSYNKKGTLDISMLSVTYKWDVT